MTDYMKIKILAAIAIPTATILGLTGCASANATCVVRHRFAIVIFQNGMANYSKRQVTHFRLEVKYWSGNVTTRFISSRITLKAANGGNPPLIVKTYRVGHAMGCHVDKVSAHL